jgi:hypothetical protein
MFGRHNHLSDRQIVWHLAGELGAQNAVVISTHLETCQACRSRRDELQTALRDVHSSYQEQVPFALLSQEEARRILQFRLAHESAGKGEGRYKAESSSHRKHKIAFAIAAGFASLALGLFIGRTLEERIRKPAIMWSMPDSRLTPGATVVLNREAVCSAANVKNKPVPVVLERKVLEEYGIRRVAPQAYEVDYLVTPALGGADDIRNLWPQSFSADWNAHVKDQLEDRLRDMVCNGELELTEAQREIAGNWIGAYKRYFHTDRPLANR